MLKLVARGGRLAWPSFITETRVVGLACLATVAIVAAGITTASPQPGAVATTALRTVTETVTVAAISRAVSDEPPERPVEPAPQTDVRYLVVPGDTLWEIAVRHYVDVSAGMRAIKRRNRLGRDNVLAGETLILPRVDRSR